MELAIKLVELFTPLLLELIKNHHPDKSDDEHVQIAKDLVNKSINNSKEGESECP